jgi:hypothetical protein
MLCHVTLDLVAAFASQRDIGERVIPTTANRD